MPLDEEGEVPEDRISDMAPSKSASSETDNISETSEPTNKSEDVANEEGGEEGEAPPESEVSSDSPQVDEAEQDFSTEEQDRHSRILDTRLRRQFEQLLESHDPRFAIEGFRKARKEPLKIQHLIRRGWTEWLKEDKWLKGQADRLNRL